MRYRCRRRRRRCPPPTKKRGRIVRVSQVRVLDTTDTRSAAVPSYSPPCCRHPAHGHRRSEHGSCGRSIIYVCRSWSGLPISGQSARGRAYVCAEMEVSGFGIESLSYSRPKAQQTDERLGMHRASLYSSRSRRHGAWSPTLGLFVRFDRRLSMSRREQINGDGRTVCG